MVALRARFFEAQDYANPYLDGQEIVFLEWMDPLFVGGHWTPQIIEYAGAQHSLNAAGHASRIVTPEAIVQAQPEMIIICPCGFTIEQTQAELDVLLAQGWWSDLPAVRAGRVSIVDGSAMFNRPGPRLVDALCWLVATINGRPELTPSGFPAVSVPHP